jgi:hypothetical protein
MKADDDAKLALQDLLGKGDVGKLSIQQRNAYYFKVCEGLNLNPYTRPFEFMTLDGKLVMYPTRGCADQLRKINKISLKIESQELTGNILTVHVKAKDSSGREDEDIGSVYIAPNLHGSAKSNMFMRAVTKAKRRVTLSISGLGWADDSELDDIPGAQRVQLKVAPDVMTPPANENVATNDNAVLKPADESDVVQGYDKQLADAAQHGSDVLREMWEGIPIKYQRTLKAALDRRHKVVAQAIDEARAAGADPETGEVT